MTIPACQQLHNAAFHDSCLERQQTANSDAGAEACGSLLVRQLLALELLKLALLLLALVQRLVVILQTAT